MELRNELGCSQLGDKDALPLDSSVGPGATVTQADESDCLKSGDALQEEHATSSTGRGGHLLRLPWRHTASRLPSHLRALAVGTASGKIPVDPQTGLALEGWPTKSHSLQEIQQSDPKLVSGLSFRTGIASGGLAVLDLDGDSAVAHCIERGCDPKRARTWQVHRDTDSARLKLIFRLSPEQQAELGEVYAKVETRLPVIGEDGSKLKKGEAVELFCHGGGHVLVLGEHPASGGNYCWPEGMGPEALATPADEWWELIKEIAANKGQSAAKTNKRHQAGDWERLGECPMCGRSGGPCSIHRDGQTLRCFHGNTFQPPQGLRKGQEVNDRTGVAWAYAGEQETSVGVFSIFVTPKPWRPEQPLFARQRQSDGDGIGATPPRSEVDPLAGIAKRKVVKHADLSATGLERPKAPVVVIRSAKGTGKTKLLSQWVGNPEERVLVITHRRSLGETLARGMGVVFRNDILQGTDGQLLVNGNPIERPHRLCLCAESLMGLKLDDWNGATLVLDEAEQLLHNVLTSDTLKDKRGPVLERFRKLVEKSTQVIAVDADLAAAPAWLASCRREADPLLLIDNRLNAQQAGEVFLFQGARDEQWMAELLEAVSKGERPYVTTDSVNWAKSIHHALEEATGGTGVLITSETNKLASNRNVITRLKDRDELDIAGVGWVVASPAIASGLSIEHDYFTSVWGCYGSGTASAADCAQALARVRRPVPRYVWVKP